jgi:hypothetical protein
MTGMTGLSIPLHESPITGRQTALSSVDFVLVNHAPFYPQKTALEELVGE